MKIKICGITNREDALHAVECGADALGFNFYEKSPRYIAPGSANDIVQRLPRHVTTVGVFVNSSIDEVHDIFIRAFLDVVQLHGDETPAFVSSLGGELKVIKAIHLSAPFDVNSILQYRVDDIDDEVPGFLLDTPSTNYGGSGKKLDWELATKFKEVVPDFYLAGGLTPDNVADAIRTVRPMAVDVCSGVEAYKGKKDPKKVAAFIKAVRSVS
jgi:phosphoribosylanthranilate isomerase